FVGVEGQHHAVGETPQQVEVLLGEGGPAGGDGFGHSRPVEGDDVGVSLDDDGTAAAGDGGAGLVQAVEEPGFVVDGGVGRVEVLGAVPAEKAGAEPGRVASQVVYREHHPAPEVVVEPAAPSPSGQAGLDHDPVGDPRRPQLLDERIPRLRGPAQLVLLDDVGVVAAPAQVLAGRAGVRGGL